VVPPLQIGAFTVNEKGWKAANPPHGGLIVTTSIHPDPCKKPHGDYVNQLSVMNKLDYVKLHGYEFHLATRVIDKSLPKLCAPRLCICCKPIMHTASSAHHPLWDDASFKTDTWTSCVNLVEQHRGPGAASDTANSCCHASRYTKIGLLRKLLRETSRERAEWILWLDADTLLEELAFQLPMSAYDSKNFIAWGNADYLWAGDQFHGKHACNLTRPGPSWLVR